MITQLASQTLCYDSKVEIAPHWEPRYNTFMQLSMKAHVMVTQLMSQTLTMHCMLIQCAGVSTWESQPMQTAPREELSPPFQLHHTDPRPRNGYDAHLTQKDNYTMSIGLPDMDMVTILGTPPLDS